MDLDKSKKPVSTKDIVRAAKTLRTCRYDFDPVPYIQKGVGKGILVSIRLPEYANGFFNRLILLKSKQEAEEFIMMCTKCNNVKLKYELTSPYASCAFVYRNHEFSSLDEFEQYLNSDEMKKEEAQKQEVRDKGTYIQELRNRRLFSTEQFQIAYAGSIIYKTEALLKKALNGDGNLDIKSIERQCASLEELLSEEKIDEKGDYRGTNIKIAIANQQELQTNWIKYKMIKEKIKTYIDISRNGHFSQSELEKRWKEIEAAASEEINGLSEKAEKLEEFERWLDHNFNSIYCMQYNDTRIFDALIQSYSLPFFSDERMEKLQVLKDFATMSIERQKEEREKAEAARQIKKIEELESRPDVKTLKSLRKQYDSNLTLDQKDAIIIYQSALFCFFSEISAIEDYKTKTPEELWTILKEKKVFHLVSQSGSFDRLIKYREQNRGNHDDRLLRILNKVLPEGCNEIKFGKNSDENMMQELIENIRKQMDIIEGIPKDSLVLPQDVVTYRGIQIGSETINPIRPSKGELISTSLSCENAQQFNNRDIFFKLNLKKGMPVLYSPYYIVADEFGRIMLLERDLNEELKSNEVVLNMQDIDMIHEGKKTIAHKYIVDTNLEDIENQSVAVGRGVPKPHEVVTYECDVIPSRTYEISIKDEKTEEDTTR